MAKKQGRVGIGIDFNVNQQSLNNIKKSLKELRSMSKEQIEQSGGQIVGMDKGAIKSWKNDLGAIRKELDALDKAFEDAFNPKLGTYELNKFNASLKESGTSAQQAFQAISGYGEKGSAALLDMTTNMLAVDRAAKQVNNTFKKLGDTMMNTLRWTLTSTAVNTVTGAIQQAYNYSLDLDKSLNDIRIVTQKSSGEMEKFAREANKAAKSLGASTTDYTEASLIYYQQGLSDKEVKARTETTIKTAKVTGQSASQVSEQLTAVWNGYKVNAEEAEAYIDKLSAVAAATAADLEELSTGMSRVASAANVMGVDVDQLNAQLATIVSVTREAPESIGTALKTVYARMSDIEAGLDTETTFGEYTSQMAQMGINVLDAQGKLRDMGDVVEEIGGKWSSLNREQQVSLAQSIAGTRQYSRMIALFDNWDMYQESLTTSLESAGALTRQHAIYLESTEAHLEKLGASSEGLYDSIFNTKEMNRVYDLLSGIVTTIDNLVESIGGMPGVLSLAVMLFGNIAKNSIAHLFTQREQNKLAQEMNRQQVEYGKKLIETLKDQNHLSDEMKEVLAIEEQIYDVAENLTDEQWAKAQEIIRATNADLQKEVAIQEELKRVAAEKAAIEQRQKTIKEADKVLTSGKGEKYDWSNPEDVKKAQKEARGLKDKVQSINAKEKKGITLTKEEKSDKARLKALQDRIKANKEIEKQGATDIEQTKKLDKQFEKLTKSAEELKIIRENNKNQLQFEKENVAIEQEAKKIGDLTAAVTTANFGMTALAGGVTNIANAFREGGDGVQGFLQGITGVGAGLGSLIKGGKQTITTIKSMKFTTDAGAMSWTSFWAAATMGISFAITAFQSVLSIVTGITSAISENRSAILEDNTAKQEEIKANLELVDSYEELYEKYEETGKASEDLRNIAEQLIEKYEIENGLIFLQTENYKALTEAIRAKQKAEENALITSAQESKGVAESKLLENIKGVTDVENASGEMDIRFSQGSSGEDEGKNYQILEEAVNSVGAKISLNGNSIEISTPDKSSFAYLYNALSSAYAKMENKEKSEIAKNVKQMLDSESYAEGSQAYISATQLETSTKATQKVRDTNFDNLSISSFNKTRADFISAAVASGTDEQEAANIFDKEVNQKGGVAAQLAQRAAYIKQLRDEGIGNLNQLESLIELDKLSNSEFSFLMSLDAEQFQDDFNKMVEAAQNKLTEAREAAWVSQSEARLKSLNNELDRLQNADIGDNVDKVTDNMAKQAANLIKQSAIYFDVYDEQKKAFTKSVKEFRDEVKDIGIFDQYGAELNDLINSGDWENLRNKVMDMEGLSEDQRESLLKLVTSMLGASNDLVDAEDDYLENQNKITQLRLDAIDKVSEAYDKQRDILSDVNSLLEHQKTLTELHLGDNADLSSYYTSALGLQQNMVMSYSQQVEAYSAYMNSIDFESLSEEEKQKVEENFRSATTSMSDALVEYANLAAEQFQNFVKTEINTFNSQLTGGLSRTALSNEIKWAQRERERYLDPINAAYGKDNLKTNFKKAISNTSNVSAQKKLNDLMKEEFKILESIDKLSQYDLDRAQKKLEILEAEIALMEAQENKSELRLVRNAEGEYTYQYVANMAAIEEAQERVKTANQELYQLDLDKYEENLDMFYEMYEEYLDAMAAAYTDGTLSDEERKELEKYQKQLGVLADEAVRVNNNLEDSIELAAANIGIDATNAASIVESRFSTALGNIVKQFTDKDGTTIASKIETMFSTLENESKRVFGENGEGGIVGNIREALNKLKASLETLVPTPEQMDQWRELAKLIENAMATQITSATSKEEAETWLRTNYGNESGEITTKTFADLASGKMGGVAAAYANAYTSKGGNSRSLQFSENSTVSFASNKGVSSVGGSTGTIGTKEWIQNEITNWNKDYYGDSDLEITNWNQLEEYLEGKLVKGKVKKPDGSYFTKEDIPALLAQYTESDFDFSNPNTTKTSTSTYLTGQKAKDAIKRIQEHIKYWWGEKQYYIGPENLWTDTDPSSSEEVQNLYNQLSDSDKLQTRYAFAGGKLRPTDKFYNWQSKYEKKAFQNTQEMSMTLDGSNITSSYVMLDSNDTRLYSDANGMSWVKASIRGQNNTIFVPLGMLYLKDNIFTTSAGGLAAGFDTGGYTGDWHSSEGRMAVLHEKEIVLNKEDSANFLDALQILRSLNLSMLETMSGMNGALRAPSLNHESPTNNTIEQTVYINAEFPDANDVQEIKEAFDQIVDLATQQAFKTSRV